MKAYNPPPKNHPAITQNLVVELNPMTEGTIKPSKEDCFRKAPTKETLG